MKKNEIKSLNNLIEKYGEDNVRRALEQLDVRNQEIIKMYYGLDGVIPKTTEEIAEIYDIARVSVYAILKRDLVKVEKCLTNPQNLILATPCFYIAIILALRICSL